MNSFKTIAVLGGGAAGMMAAVAAAEGFDAGARADGADAGGAGKNRVLLFEKNAYLGAKVIISGGGRCNLTTGIFDVKKLLENYPRGAKFLMSAQFRFPPEKVKEWFESRGVPLKTEKDLRVFPVSNNGKDVVGALGAELERLGVEVFFNAGVVEILDGAHTASRPGDLGKQGGAELGGGEENGTVANGKAGESPKFALRLKDGRTFEADAVIITTGGNAYSQTGSTGDGYAFAKYFGHTVTPLSPSLSSFAAAEPWVKNVTGVSFEKVEISLKSADGLRSYKRLGPMLFTHHGVSGPTVFAVSAMASYEKYDKLKPMKLSVNFFPLEKPEALKKRFMNLADRNGKKFLVNFLDIFLPRSLCEVFEGVLRLDPELLTAKLTREARGAILGLMQGLELTVTGRGAGDEFVTAGGVALDEVNTNTMESKKRPGLYFAGEILDIDGFTGGFNLQASWATGRLAGESAAKKMAGA